jgi:PTH1 family peptidyl-tRNA hydrolase
MAEGSLAGRKVALMKPVTYMNRSGGAILPFAQYYKVPLERVVVVCDDVNLPFGRIRLRLGGSHGGHNGLRDIIEGSGTDQFPRLRIGCAPMRPARDLAGYVLSPMWGEGLELSELAVEVAGDCVEMGILEGLHKAMSVFNSWWGKPAGSE